MPEVNKQQQQIDGTLRRGEERFEALARLSPDAIYLHVDGRVTFANPAMCRLLGADDPSQLVGKSVFEIVHPDYHEVVRKRWESLSGGTSVSMIVETFVRLDGSTVDVEVSATQLGSHSGGEVQVIARDISARKQSEKHVEHLNRVYSVLSDINQTIIRETDTPKLLDTACRVAVKQGAFRMAWIGLLNPETQQIEVAASAGADHDTLEILSLILGKKEMECNCAFTLEALLTGAHSICNDIAHDPKSTQWREGALQRYYRSMASLPLKRGNQTVGTFNLYSSEVNFFDDAEMTLLDELAVDVSFALKVHRQEADRKAVDAALRLSEAQLRATFDNAAVGIALVNPDGHPVKSNPALSRMLGYSEAELSRMTFIEFTHPDDAELDLRLHHELQEGKRTHYEIEKRYIRKDGQVVWGRLTISLVKQPDDATPLALGMVEDVTARHKLEEQFLQAQKMEAIGQLAGGVAHDFNNILAVIQLQSGMLAADENLEPAQRELTVQIIHAAERAANLTRQLLMFSRRQAIRPANVNLNEVVANMTKMLQRILGEDISLTAKYAPHLPVIMADTGMIEQIILNLAVNSRDAMPGGGKLTIATSVETLDPDPADQNSGPAPALHVQLSVADEGSGIAPEDLPHIFEPFFTTKPVGQGTGLGLATVYGIVQQHRGRISVSSRVGKGTTFHVCFPASAGAVIADEKNAHSLGELPRGHETILLVEDEMALRFSVTHALQLAGYTVLSAESGREALKVWRDHQDKIQLVLTDIVMPDGVSGFDLGRQLQTERPQLKVVYTSGYTGEIAEKHFNLVEGVNFLQKPFDLSALAATLRKNLDGK